MTFNWGCTGFFLAPAPLLSLPLFAMELRWRGTEKKRHVPGLKRGLLLIASCLTSLVSRHPRRRDQKVRGFVFAGEGDGQIVGQIVSDRERKGVREGREGKRTAKYIRRGPTTEAGEKLLESGTYRRWWYSRKETYLIKNSTRETVAPRRAASLKLLPPLQITTYVGWTLFTFPAIASTAAAASYETFAISNPGEPAENAYALWWRVFINIHMYIVHYFEAPRERFRIFDWNYISAAILHPLFLRYT